ncbi:MAG: PIN domain-containing protein [Abditibacteriaceae bacterium]
MNIKRLIWFIATILFCIIGLMLGYTLGQSYILIPYLSGALEGKPGGTMVIITTTICGGIILARLGSWLAERFLVNGIGRFQSISPAVRLLSIVGVMLGLIFAVLVTWPLPNNPYWWILLKLGAMLFGATSGMALLQGMREDMLNVFPQLEKLDGGTGTNSSPQRPKLLDTNIIIDGRLATLCKTGFIDGPIYVPSFVLDEVQLIADSSDSLKRARGKRGLDVLNAMRDLTKPQQPGAKEPIPMLNVYSDIPPQVRRINTVDSKLVELAKIMNAAIITNDTNLNRVAALQGLQVLNLNELTQALRPVVLPGEEMNILISREGKEAAQGVGYLDDGTMVVVNDAKKHIGETCKVNISSVIQTVAGKMIFAELKIKGSGDDLFNDDTDTNGNNSSGGLRRKSRT